MSSEYFIPTVKSESQKQVPEHLSQLTQNDIISKKSIQKSHIQSEKEPSQYSKYASEKPLSNNTYSAKSPKPSEYRNILAQDYDNGKENQLSQNQSRSKKSQYTQQNSNQMSHVIQNRSENERPSTAQSNTSYASKQSLKHYQGQDGLLTWEIKETIHQKRDPKSKYQKGKCMISKPDQRFENDKYFKNTRVNTCSKIVNMDGIPKAIASFNKPPKNSFEVSQQMNFTMSMNKESYIPKPISSCGDKNKPLTPYNPNASRNKLPTPTVKMPYKNSSTLSFGSDQQKVAQVKKKYKNLQKQLIQETNDLSINLGLNKFSSYVGKQQAGKPAVNIFDQIDKNNINLSNNQNGTQQQSLRNKAIFSQNYNKQFYNSDFKNSSYNDQQVKNIFGCQNVQSKLNGQSLNSIFGQPSFQFDQKFNNQNGKNCSFLGNNLSTQSNNQNSIFKTSNQNKLETAELFRSRQPAFTSVRNNQYSDPLNPNTSQNQYQAQMEIEERQQQENKNANPQVKAIKKSSYYERKKEKEAKEKNENSLNAIMQLTKIFTSVIQDKSGKKRSKSSRKSSIKHSSSENKNKEQNNQNQQEQQQQQFNNYQAFQPQPTLSQQREQNQRFQDQLHHQQHAQQQQNNNYFNYSFFDTMTDIQINTDKFLTFRGKDKNNKEISGGFKQTNEMFMGQQDNLMNQQNMAQNNSNSKKTKEDVQQEQQDQMVKLNNLNLENSEQRAIQI